jgi:hypothetical protein
VPPASIARSTLSSRAAWRGAPHREGCFAEAAFSTARSARSPTSDASRRRPGKPRRVRADCSMPVSRSTSRSARSAFHQQVLPAPACAGQGARHRFPEQVPGIGFRRCAFLARARKAEPARTYGVGRPGAGQAKRRLSTSAITAVLQHNCGRIRHPAPRQGVASLARGCRQPCTSRRKTGRAVPGQGPPKAETFASISACDDSPRSFAPTPVRSDTSCHGIAPAQVEESRRKDMEQVPAIPSPDSVQAAVRTRA